MFTMRDEGDEGYPAGENEHQGPAGFTWEERAEGMVFAIKLIAFLSLMLTLTLIVLGLGVLIFILLLLEFSIFETQEGWVALVIFAIFVFGMAILLILLLKTEEKIARRMGLHSRLELRDVDKDGHLTKRDDPRYHSTFMIATGLLVGAPIIFLISLIKGWLPGVLVVPFIGLILIGYLTRVSDRHEWQI